MKKHRNIIRTFFETIYGALTPERTQEAVKIQQDYLSFRAKARSQRNFIEKVADEITAGFGSIIFAVFHIFWFTLWILINTGQFDWLPIFDPFPFGLLTMIVSLEAIFLSIFVLLSQNRESQITDLRSEIDFHINRQAEMEITKAIEMIQDLHEHFKLDKGHEKEVAMIKKPLDPDKLAQEIQKEEGH